jgi:hypothetical protein
MRHDLSGWQIDHKEAPFNLLHALYFGLALYGVLGFILLVLP